MSTTEPTDQSVTWYALPASEASARLSVDPTQGLTDDEHAATLSPSTGRTS